MEINANWNDDVYYQLLSSYGNEKTVDEYSVLEDVY